jgi:hypothetical protein
LIVLGVDRRRHDENYSANPKRRPRNRDFALRRNCLRHRDLQLFFDN